MPRGGRPVYVISIAANLTGCHPRTLRIYEEEGLLEPVRTESNIRLYSDLDVRRVRVIRYLTQVRGVNLAGVKMVLQLRDIAELTRDFADALEAMEDASDRNSRPSHAVLKARTSHGYAGPSELEAEGREPLGERRVKNARTSHGYAGASELEAEGREPLGERRVKARPANNERQGT